LKKIKWTFYGLHSVERQDKNLKKKLVEAR